MNLSPVASSQKAPEQCEALNLGKKPQGANNNNAGEHDEQDAQPSAKRVRTGGSSSTPPRAEVAVGPRSSPGSGVRDPADYYGDGDDDAIEMDIDVTAGKWDRLRSRSTKA